MHSFAPTVPTIPNWDDAKQGVGQWRYFEYDFDVLAEQLRLEAEEAKQEMGSDDEEFDNEKAEEEYAKLIAEQKKKREEEEEKETLDTFQNRFQKTSLFGNLKKNREAKKAADAKKNVRATM